MAIAISAETVRTWIESCGQKSSMTPVIGDVPMAVPPSTTSWGASVTCCIVPGLRYAPKNERAFGPATMNPITRRASTAPPTSAPPARNRSLKNLFLNTKGSLSILYGGKIWRSSIISKCLGSIKINRTNTFTTIY